MLVEYTPISTLSPSELQRLQAQAKTLGESSLPYVMFEGKTIRTAEVRSLIPVIKNQQLNG